MTANSTPSLSDLEIGYTYLETGHASRFDNCRTMRSHVVRADGSSDHEIGSALVESTNHWTQLAGWLRDGRAVVLCAWQSDEYAQIEQRERRFIHTAESRRSDVWVVDTISGEAINVSAPDRVSELNGGIIECPGGENLILSAVVDGHGCLYLMKRDGSGKTPMAESGFSYGAAISHDGTRAAWHQDYQIVVSNSDGSDAVNLITGRPFNFGPAWSPADKHLMFLAGKSNIGPSICVADAHHLTCRLVARRTGYIGAATVMDDGDFHGGSTDLFKWSDDHTFYFTAAARDGNVELFMSDIRTRRRKRLTHSPAGSSLSHPLVSPCGKWVALTGLIGGARNIFVFDTQTRRLAQVTHYAPGQGAIHPHWRPRVDNPTA